MTLAISVHQRTAGSDELGPNLVTETGAELAGWEVWRSSVYGAAAVGRRGARFLPRLASADLVVEGDELFAFQKECQALLSDVGSLALELQVDVEALRFRLSNIASAIDCALSIGGVVWIS